MDRDHSLLPEHAGISSMVIGILLIALLALFANSWLPFRTFLVLEQERLQRWESRELVARLDRLLLSMVDAETGERGYIISGRTEFLEPYYAANATNEQLLKEIAPYISKRQELAKEWKELTILLAQSHDFLRQAVKVREEQGFQAAVNLVNTGEGKLRMDAVRNAVIQMTEQENKLVALSMDYELREMKFSKISLVLLTIMDFILFGFAFFLTRKTLRANRKNQQLLKELHLESTLKNDALAKSQHMQELQNKMVNSLQMSSNMKEAYGVIEKFSVQIFENHSGVFYTRSHSKDYYERVSAWGVIDVVLDGFDPTQCWSARTGHMHRFDSSVTDMPCGHFHEGALENTTYTCIPVSANGEMIGMLLLLGGQDGAGMNQPVSQDAEQLAKAVVEKIGLAIANIQLRDTLRSSSIIDPLSGLYNRRYLEETLRREMNRAERLSTTIGIMMLDIDHFKRFNDTYGHEAGDLVLREAAQELKKQSRLSDVACRYGGEEFILVMPEASLETMRSRAEAIRLAIKQLNIVYGGKSIGSLTVSIGLAVYPYQGVSAEKLIKSADDALYQAKHSGRDQVVFQALINESENNPEREPAGSGVDESCAKS